MKTMLLKNGFSKGVQYMLLGSLCFSVMNALVKAVPHIPPIEIVLFRSVITLVMSLSVLYYSKIPAWGNNPKMLMARGVFGSLSLISYFYVIHHIPLASAVALQYLSPIFTVILAHFYLGERLRVVQWFFFIISFSGVLMMKGFDTRVSIWFVLLGMFSALMSAYAYISIRKMRGLENPMVIVLYFPVVTVPVASVWAYFEWVRPEGWDWFYLITIGVLTQFAQVFMTKAHHADSTDKVVSVNYISIIYAFLIGYMWFGELFNLPTALGIVLIAAGILLNIFYKRG